MEVRKGEKLVAKDLFMDLWERTSEVFGGQQEIHSNILKRKIKYYVIPKKDGVPIIHCTMTNGKY